MNNYYYFVYPTPQRYKIEPKLINTFHEKVWEKLSYSKIAVHSWNHVEFTVNNFKFLTYLWNVVEITEKMKMFIEFSNPGRFVMLMKSSLWIFNTLYIFEQAESEKMITEKMDFLQPQESSVEIRYKLKIHPVYSKEKLLTYFESSPSSSSFSAIEFKIVTRSQKNHQNEQIFNQIKNMKRWNSITSSWFTERQISVW